MFSDMLFEIIFKMVSVIHLIIGNVYINTLFIVEGQIFFSQNLYQIGYG